MPLLSTAIAIAAEAHKNQKDKYGKEYIHHPLRVMNRVHSEDEKIVAILHDVVEDSSWTLDQLRRKGFPEHIISALDSVTKREGESYEQSIERVAQGNELARKVKIADLEDNMDLLRLPEIDAKAADRLARYLRAWHRLQQP